MPQAWSLSASAFVGHNVIGTLGCIHTLATLDHIRMIMIQDRSRQPGMGGTLSRI